MSPRGGGPSTDRVDLHLGAGAVTDKSGLGRDIAAEFGLPAPVRAEVLAGGGPHVLRIVTGAGAFVAKPVVEPDEAELYAAVADALNRRGVRQARPRRTPAGNLVSPSGWGLTEWLPGRIHLPPAPEQTLAVMRHLAAYQTALAAVPAPAFLDGRKALWQDVTRPAWLGANLPGLLERSPFEWMDRGLVAAGLARLEGSAPSVAGLASQLVHGDVAPDNVLMDGTSVVAVIDFTPFHAPAASGLATALYWYHVRSLGGGTDPPPLDLAALARSVDAYAEVSPLGAGEREVLPALVLGEALRRLATSLAGGAANQARFPEVGRRYRAVALLVDAAGG